MLSPPGWQPYCPADADCLSLFVHVAFKLRLGSLAGEDIQEVVKRICPLPFVVLFGEIGESLRDRSDTLGCHAFHFHVL
jgi:hypothetical protein